LPLHPAVVHVPLGIAFVVPLVAIGVALALWRGRASRRVFAVVVSLQLLVAFGAWAALATGEREEEKVERLVAESLIEDHEEAAETFLAASVIASIIGLAALFARGERVGRWAVAGAIAASLVVAALGLRVGRLGGEMAYVHGAAEAYRGGGGSGGGAAPTEGRTRPRRDDGEEEREDDDEDERTRR